MTQSGSEYTRDKVDHPDQHHAVSVGSVMLCLVGVVAGFILALVIAGNPAHGLTPADSTETLNSLDLTPSEDEELYRVSGKSGEAVFGDEYKHHQF